MYNNFKLTKKIPNNKDFISIINNNNYIQDINNNNNNLSNTNIQTLNKSNSNQYNQTLSYSSNNLLINPSKNLKFNKTKKNSFNSSNKKRQEIIDIYVNKTPIDIVSRVKCKISANKGHHKYSSSITNLNKNIKKNIQSCVNINKEYLLEKIMDEKNKKHSKNINSMTSLKNQKIPHKNSKLMKYNNFNNLIKNKSKICFNKGKNLINYKSNNNELLIETGLNSNLKKNEINSKFQTYSGSFRVNKIKTNNKLIQNKKLLSIYEKITNVFYETYSTRNDITIQNKKNNVGYKYHKKTKSFNNISKDNSFSNIKGISTSSYSINKTKSNSFDIDINDKYIYKRKLEIIKKRTLNILNFYIKLAKSAVEK